MNPTPDTLNYMIGGYVVFAVVMVIYISSLISRWRGLLREQQMLGEIETKS
jgi:hypothetical protein